MNQATGDVTVSATDDGSSYVKLDDGGVKQVIKSAGLGLSDGTDENITLGADGSITAASTVQSLGSAGGYNAFSAGYGNSTTDAFVVRGNGTIVGNDAGAATTGNYKYKLDSNGSAIFTSEVTSGSAYNIGDGTVLYPQGLLGIRKDGLEAGVIQVLNGGSTTDEETVSIANTGSAGFGLNANWAGAFFGIRKGTNNWAQHISIDSTSTAPSGFLVSVGVDNPTGGTALLCQKGVPNLGGSVSSDIFKVDWDGNAVLSTSVQAGGIKTGDPAIGIGGNALTTSTAGVGPAPLTINNNTTIDHSGNISATRLTIDADGDTSRIQALISNSTASNTGCLVVYNKDTTQSPVNITANGSAQFTNNSASATTFISHQPAATSFCLSGGTSTDPSSPSWYVENTGRYFGTNITFRVAPEDPNNWETTTEEYVITETYEGPNGGTLTREVPETREIKTYVGPTLDVKDELMALKARAERQEAVIAAMTRILGDLGADVSTMPALEEGGET